MVAGAWNDGFLWDSFYRYRAAVKAGSLEALLDKRQRVVNLKNRTDERTEAMMVADALDLPG